jgi:hypothetical protein
MIAASAGPAEAQMWGFPDQAVPSSGSFIGATYGRGLNDASGKQDAVGAIAAFAGASVSFMGGIGMILADVGDNEPTIGASLGVDLMQGASSTIGVQAGLGWMSFAGITDDITTLRFPIGVSVKGSFESPEAVITPWAMPRLNIMRASSGGASNTETDFGASGGVMFEFGGGFGLHALLDVLFASQTAVSFGAGGQYHIGM